MDVSNNSLQSLIQPTWAEKVEFLNADTNLLANLSSTTLSGFVDLTELHVANNRLLFISPTALSQLPMLQSLHLDDNALTSLFGGVFFNQSNLVELSITNNRLTLLHTHYFMGLVSLERLYLAGNQLTSVNSQMFQLVPEIITLDLSRNELQLIDMQDCVLNPNLHNISLARNMIHDTNKVFGYCSNLEKLDLSYNLIRFVRGDSLSGRNEALSNLDLEGNPLQCDCRLTGLRDWLRNNPPYVEPRCEGPKQHYGSVITDLDIKDFSCKRPKVVADRKSLTVVAGQNTVLACTAKGIPAPTITWLSPNGTEIPHEWQGRFAILQGRILHITPVQKSDQGVYTCLVHNVLGEMNDAVVDVTVSTSPATSVNALLPGVTDIPAILIAIVVTLSVVAFVIVFRRRCKKPERGTDVKVVFRSANDGDGTTDDTPVERNRYVPTPATKNPSCQIDDDFYEEPTVGKHDIVDDREVYENVDIVWS
ncbi:phospholipase A2 inhibitor-like [Asterias rubens]|uniref:phospholipase A2 inhibitor-like n=1 Tax=Asterias rubens TaxID=7604 RepID=UPI00145579F2|nr:phospholipase A2 inhibitor-like [Asterias rubens]